MEYMLFHGVFQRNREVPSEAFVWGDKGFLIFRRIEMLKAFIFVVSENPPT